jgi:hypothetical protein
MDETSLLLCFRLVAVLALGQDGRMPIPIIVLAYLVKRDVAHYANDIATFLFKYFSRSNFSYRTQLSRTAL